MRSSIIMELYSRNFKFFYSAFLNQLIFYIFWKKSFSV